MACIQIYDTTLRDGSQGEGVNFSLQDKLLITRRLDDLGVDYIEGGYPLSNQKDSEFFQAIREIPLKHTRVAAFGMTRRKGLKAADDTGMKALIESQAPVITIVGKTWDLHVRDVLTTTLEENLAMIGDSVAFCRSAGPEVIYDAEHFFDGFRANPDYALRTLRAAQDAGARTVVLCDTNGGTLPDEIAAAVEQARQNLKVDIGIHCHNDCDVAVSNTLAAVSRGATHVQGTINGIGERCGNADLVSIIANLSLKRGYEVLRPGSLPHLTEVSRYVYETANMNFRPNQPFVGVSAFAHKGGMHAHGIARNPATYEHIDPAVVGNERRILLSELSGQASILAKLSGTPLSQDRALTTKVLNLVQDLEHEGYEFEAAEASFALLVRKAAGRYQPKFQRLAYRVNVETGGQGPPVTEATVKVRVPGEPVMHTVSEGDGPVNALDGALRKALQPYYPRLQEMHLMDYKVRVVNARAETAAKVRVVIEWRDGDAVWGTVGVSENIIEASWLALVDSFEYKLFKDEGQSGSATLPLPI
jgi:2-isopropylmalate synthase